MPNYNPPPLPPEHQFKPGQSGNPGGISKEMRAQITANAEAATRIRAALLAKIERGIVDGVFADDLSGDILSLVKSTEDRGLGAPKVTTEIGGPDGGPVSLTGIAVSFVRPDPQASDA